MTNHYNGNERTSEEVFSTIALQFPSHIQIVWKSYLKRIYSEQGRTSAFPPLLPLAHYARSPAPPRQRRIFMEGAKPEPLNFRISENSLYLRMLPPEASQPPRPWGEEWAQKYGLFTSAYWIPGAVLLSQGGFDSAASPPTEKMPLPDLPPFKNKASILCLEIRCSASGRAVRTKILWEKPALWLS